MIFKLDEQYSVKSVNTTNQSIKKRKTEHHSLRENFKYFLRKQLLIRN